MRATLVPANRPVPVPAWANLVEREDDGAVCYSRPSRIAVTPLPECPEDTPDPVTVQAIQWDHVSFGPDGAEVTQSPVVVDVLGELFTLEDARALAYALIEVTGHVAGTFPTN